MENKVEYKNRLNNRLEIIFTAHIHFLQSFNLNYVYYSSCQKTRGKKKYVLKYKSYVNVSGEIF